MGGRLRGYEVTVSAVWLGFENWPGQKSGVGVGATQSLSVAQPSLNGAIMRHIKVEEIAEAVAKLRPDQLARSAVGSLHSRRAAPTAPMSSTPLRLNLAASPAALSLN
jgi:hypothetical protein